jgi:hypothetical protein
MTAPQEIPSTARTSQSPDLRAAGRGVVISAPARVPLQGPLLVHGGFLLDREEADRIDAQLHRALVVVASYPGGSRLWTPFREHALFPDDEDRSGDARSGYFTVDLRRFFDLRENPEWFLHASVGGHVSNIVKVRIE